VKFSDRLGSTGHAFPNGILTEAVPALFKHFCKVASDALRPAAAR
jgi:hypothetical protein